MKRKKKEKKTCSIIITIDRLTFKLEKIYPFNQFNL